MSYIAHLQGGAADGETIEIATIHPEIRTGGAFEGRNAIKGRWVYPTDTYLPYPVDVYLRDQDNMTDNDGIWHIPYRYNHTIPPRP